MIFVEVGGSMWGYMEAHGSFHGIYSWKLQSMEEMEASTSTDSGKFHVFPMGSKSTSTNFHGNFQDFSRVMICPTGRAGRTRKV